jgi:hypothetical protein
MSGLSRAAANRAHVLAITAHAHAVEVYRAGDADQALAALDTIAKQLGLIGDVLAGNEGPLDDDEVAP